MGEIRINLDQGIIKALERRAAEHGRDVAEEISNIVADDLAGRLRPVDPVEWSRRIRAMTPPGVRQTPAVQLIREDRDRDE